MSEVIKTKTARELAVETLDKVFSSGAYSNLQLNQVIKRNNLKDVDRRLLTNLVYGVIQHKLTLEFWLAKFVGDCELDSWIRVLLLVSLYQYQFLDKLPDFAVTDEAIKIAKHRGHDGIRKYVTAILHRILREGVPAVSDIQDPLEQTSILYSVPKWLVTELTIQYGQQQTTAILESLNQPAQQSVRLNQRFTDLQSVRTALTKEGFEYRDSQVAENALVITSGVVTQSQLFKDGLITIQDESAMLAVENMHLQSSDHVLDACAAPGGKTVQIAEALQQSDDGHVWALDIHAKKVKLIQTNARRLSVDDTVTATTLDARKVDNQFPDASFDAILVDAPCSGFGLMRRKPEIRYEKQLVESYNLQKIQLSILDAVAPKIKKNGIITYSTCTILKQENDDVVTTFLKHHSEFELETTTTAKGVHSTRKNATLTVLPSDFGSDGFFVSSLRRK